MSGLVRKRKIGKKIDTSTMKHNSIEKVDVTHMLYELKEMVGDTGRVLEMYGGYEITIYDYEKFPWYKVCDHLLESSFEIWMVKRKLTLIIMAKPAID